jgi:hypothetical protein
VREKLDHHPHCHHNHFHRHNILFSVSQCTPLPLQPPPPPTATTTHTTTTTIIATTVTNYCHHCHHPLRYRQLWDMKIIQPKPSALSANANTTATKSNAPPDVSIAAPWLWVTDLDSSRVTIQGASIRELDLFGGPLGNFTVLNDVAIYDTQQHRGQLGTVTRPDDCTVYVDPPPLLLHSDPVCCIHSLSLTHANLSNTPNAHDP